MAPRSNRLSWDDYDLYINTKALTALGMEVPEDLTEAAVECGE